MHFLIAITGIFLLGYALLILYYHSVWDRIPDGGKVQPRDTSNEKSEIQASPSGRTLSVSVIIPARNEAARIRNCLDALLIQDYPVHLTEIIIVNDFSTDDTALIVLEYGPRCRLLNLSDYVSTDINAYKKKALETGIRESAGELILCTDADCTMGPEWVTTIVQSMERNRLECIAGPVKIVSDGSALSVFQILDFISLQGITGAAVYKNLYPMSNGANFAYRRQAYDTVEGFTGIDHIASGDDMLLMKKIQSRFPGKVGYIKDSRAIVSTRSAETIAAFFRQRIRWASKIFHYRDFLTFTTLAGVYLVNTFLMILFIGCLFHGHWRWLLILLAFKTVSEYFFVSKVANFFGQQTLMKFFPVCQPFHIVYTVIAGGFGSFGKYEWKGRKVK